jgi:hypothetical protein
MEVGMLVVWCFDNVKNMQQVTVEGEEGRGWQGGGGVRRVVRRGNKIEITTEEGGDRGGNRKNGMDEL